MAVVVIEVVSCYLPIVWLKRSLAILSLVLIAADSVILVFIKPSVWTILIVYFSIFRIINLIKLIKGRKQVDYLRSSFLRASFFLIISQGVVLVLSYLVSQLAVSYKDVLAAVSWLILSSLIIISLSLRRALNTTKPKLTRIDRLSHDLPTLSVCLPARDETIDLEQCLISLINSDYPKLEILVLDDCSQEKRTPEIIRQFAHDGVRFIEGSEAPDSWTAKNFAYQKLAEAANGEVVLFCGVDVRFDHHTLSQMVELKLAKHKTMLSFMPINSIGKSFKSLLIQPMRYLWELALPRRTLNRPPVLSTCWMIDLDVLNKFGGFKAVSRSILPERYFARQTARQNDGYSFICLGQKLGLSSSKVFDQQLSTQLRTRYPQLKQSLFNISMVCLAEFLIFVAPIGLLVYELINFDKLLVILCLIIILTSGLVVMVIGRQTYGRNLFVSLIAYPLLFSFDIGLSFYSMWLYEFRQVIWKGRNVCIPVMRLIN